MKTLALILLLVPAAALAAPPSGREVLEKQEEARKIGSFQARASLSTVKEGEPEKAAKKFRWWRKLGDGGRFVTLTRFDEPATIRGEGVLIREGQKENDVKLYLPLSAFHDDAERKRVTARGLGSSQTAAWLDARQGCQLQSQADPL